MKAEKVRSIESRIVALNARTTIITAAVLCIVGYLFMLAEMRSAAEQRLQALMDIHSVSLASSLSALATDARFFATLPDTLERLQVVAPGGHSHSLDHVRHAELHLQEAFRNFLIDHPYLKQIRLIGTGETAPELVRVDWAGDTVRVVPQHLLQFKGDEPYMLAAESLAPGDWLLSDVTLNRERGAVQEDSRLTIRAVHAIENAGRTVGYIVLNADYETIVRNAIGPLPDAYLLEVRTSNGTVLRVEGQNSTPSLPSPFAQDQRLSSESDPIGNSTSIVLRRSLDIGGDKIVYLMSATPRSAIMAPINARLGQLIVVGLIVLAIATIIGRGASKRVVEPVISLTNAVPAPGSGLQTIGFDPGPLEEINVLAKAFKRTLDATIDNQRETQAIFDAAADGIVTGTSDGRIRSANRAAANMFGYSTEEIVGMPIATLIAEHNRSAYFDRREQFLVPNGDKKIDTSVLFDGVRASGEVFPIEATIKPVSVQGQTVLVSVLRDVSERKKQEKLLEERQAELSFNAVHDSLTALLNRRGLENAIEAADPSAGETTVILVDLDRFKLVNDSFGHHAGDAVLCAVAERLRRMQEPTDVIARVGGDEFVILRPGANPSATEEWAQDTICKLAEPVVFDRRVCRFGVSIGAAHGTVPDLKSGDLSQYADHALYQAKNDGRGLFRYFTRELSQSLADRKALSTDLERAVENGELSLVYMPKLEAATGNLIGLEALLRWNHPKRGVLAPGTFLGIADDLKLMGQIDCHVLELVVRDRQDWQLVGLTPPNVSVNISASRLNDPGLVTSFKDKALPRGAVSIELLESVFLDEVPDNIIVSLNALRSLGVGIEVDDFGSGHASILAVPKIGPDFIKVDRALIEAIDENEPARQTVRSIVDMACSYGVRVIAEGVETEAQLSVLENLGCFGAQGFLFGQPIAACAVPGYVRKKCAA